MVSRGDLRAARVSVVLTPETIGERLLNLGRGKRDAGGDFLKAGPEYSGEYISMLISSDIMTECRSIESG